ncbi:hypothetical protein F53441_11845 [Fusarium austroafricanum]|uniref:alpha-L-rhamnosidase n=1 Tax=Fusarium austroafricanum TaxID=2364996 RepID=A0A8H4JZS0_9HYPO|nr:hypothetical protein F53441_11845 [Fusarium austroafricanum]
MEGQSTDVHPNTRACQGSDGKEGAEDAETDDENVEAWEIEDDDDDKSDYDDSGYYDDIEGNAAGTQQNLFAGESGDSTASASGQFLELLFQLCVMLSTESYVDGQPSSTLLIYFSGILGFSADCQRFQLARQYCSKLSAIIYIQQLARKYAQDGQRLKGLFQRRYITAEGNLMSTSQTGIGLAIRFGLYPENEEQRKTAGKVLDSLVRTARFHTSTGFAGTPVISDALSEIGRSQLAYRMLLESTCPSWLYAAISHDATTVWER